MAIGDITLKKLFQGAISNVATARYTCPAGKQAQVVELWADNQNLTIDRKISLFAGGTASFNRLSHNILVAKDSGIVISDMKVILAAAEVFALNQDLGTDVIVTLYGIEEAIA